MRGGLVLLLVGSSLAVSWGLARTQETEPDARLDEPRIVRMPPQRMLVVEARGDPNVVGQRAFSLLFKTFFSLKGARMAPPRARWLTPLSAPKEEWVGLYALPVPDEITSLPSGSEGARLEEWEYGDVAEILHRGSYREEAPTVEKLMRFIAAKGYEVAGPHEEVYLKGPGMVSDPSQYLTIIRYQVKKKED